jgi:hypothetical protein
MKTETLTCDACNKKVEKFTGIFTDFEQYFGPVKKTQFEFCDDCTRTILSFIKLETDAREKERHDRT